MGYRLIKQSDGLFALFSTYNDTVFATHATREEVTEFMVQQAIVRERESCDLWFEGRLAPFMSVDEAVKEVTSAHGKKEGDETRRRLMNPPDLAHPCADLMVVIEHAGPLDPEAPAEGEHPHSAIDPYKLANKYEVSIRTRNGKTIVALNKHGYLPSFRRD